MTGVHKEVAMDTYMWLTGVSRKRKQCGTAPGGEQEVQSSLAWMIHGV
jgi:hypothetical protein